MTSPTVPTAAAGGAQRQGDAAFLPTAVRAMEFGGPLTDIVAGESSSGVPYGDLAVLARLHGDPLGLVRVGLDNGRCAATHLADRLWAALAARVREHAERDGCLRAGDLASHALVRGLTPVGEQCPGARPVAPEAPFASVIVPTCGRAVHLAECLRGLRDLGYPQFEILVVDNRPADPSTRRLGSS